MSVAFNAEFSKFNFRLKLGSNSGEVGLDVKIIFTKYK
jgi:hypothetical protein